MYDELINLSAKILLCSSREELVEISSALNDAANRLSQREEKQETTTSGFLKFTQKEISKMPKTFKKEFILNGAVAHVIKRPSGKRTFIYEIRYRRNGYNISASAKSLEEAKKKFLDKLADPHAKIAPTRKSRRLVAYIADEWLSCKTNVSQSTIKCYRSHLDRHILPVIGRMDIADVRSADLLKVMECADGMPRMYEELRTVLNSVFGYAIDNGIITYNPVRLVPFKRAERKSGTALSADEIRTFLRCLTFPDFDDVRPQLMLELYCGLRPCETETAVIEGDFIIARNAKRKNGKVEYKRIPIPEGAALAPVPKPVPVGTLNKRFKDIFPDRTQYDLRHTFATVCQQYVRREVVEIWLGDSPERLIGSTYTHFPDDFMLAEMQKVRFIPDKK